MVEPDVRSRALVLTGVSFGAFALSVVLAGVEADVWGDAQQACSEQEITDLGFAVVAVWSYLLAVNTGVALVAILTYAFSPVPVPLILLVTAVLLALAGWAFFASYDALPVVNALCPDGEPGWWPT